MFSADLLIVLRVYFISLALGLVSWPLTKMMFGKLPDRGWALTRIFTTIIAALTIWELGNMGLTVNTTPFLMIVTGVLFVINALLAWDQGKKSFEVGGDFVRMVVIEEYLFLVGLFMVTIIRGFAPNIDSLEKFMDFGFINRYLSSKTLPAEDMWQAGEIINYYSFGHFWASILIRYFAVVPAVGYNIVLGFIAGLSMQISFAIVVTISSGSNLFTKMVGGVIGAFGVVLAGNSHILWYLIEHRGLAGYWYADATRFIENTIHEFPGYSFVVADLHGHLLDLPIVLMFILIASQWIYHRYLRYEVSLGIIFGVMMMTNTWDVAVYGLLLVVASLMTLRLSRKSFVRLLQSAGVMAFFMALTALPWWTSFDSISNGIAFVTKRSELWQLAVLWTGGLIVSLIATINEIKTEKSEMVRSLFITIVLLIIIPEIVYAKDIYPDHPRANTMFKLTYQASVMIGILLGLAWGGLLGAERKMRNLWRVPALIIVVLFFCGAMIFPAQAFTSFYNNFKNYHGLDGEKWLGQMSPEKYEATVYLRNNADGRNLVETVGDSYTHESALSVFSGVPTIQGWRVHEWLWRGGYDVVGRKEGEVRKIYEDASIEETMVLLKQYNIGWIFVGPDERNNYEINDAKLGGLGVVVWRLGDAYLVEISR